MSVSVNATTCFLAATIKKTNPTVVVIPVHTPPAVTTTAHPDYTVRDTHRNK